MLHLGIWSFHKVASSNFQFHFPPLPHVCTVYLCQTWRVLGVPLIYPSLPLFTHFSLPRMPALPPISAFWNPSDSLVHSQMTFPLRNISRFPNLPWFPISSFSLQPNRIYFSFEYSVAGQVVSVSCITCKLPFLSDNKFLESRNCVLSLSLFPSQHLAEYIPQSKCIIKYKLNW